MTGFLIRITIRKLIEDILQWHFVMVKIFQIKHTKGDFLHTKCSISRDIQNIYVYI